MPKMIKCDATCASLGAVIASLVLSSLHVVFYIVLLSSWVWTHLKGGFPGTVSCWREYLWCFEENTLKRLI